MTRTFLVTLFLAPVLALADVQWHTFSVEEGKKVEIAAGRISVTVQEGRTRDPYPPEDCLVMTVSVPGQKPRGYEFISSHSYGQVAVQGDLLLLKHGYGRGTAVRVDHVKALGLHGYLEEFVDVQSSYWVLGGSKKDEPEFVEYGLKIQAEGGYTTLTFTLPKPQPGLPSEKIVKFKNHSGLAERVIPGQARSIPAEDYVLAEGQFQGVKLGAPLADLKKTFGQKLHKGIMKTGEGDFDYYSLRNETGQEVAEFYLTDDNRLRLIEIKSSLWKTTKGIHVGSTLRELRAAYGDLEIHGSESDSHTSASSAATKWVFEIDAGFGHYELSPEELASISPDTKITAMLLMMAY